MKFKVLLVDDHTVVRDGLKLILESSDSFEVAGEATNGKEAVELIEQIKPDVVLMDLNMPGMNGISAIKELNSRQINVPIVILTAYNEDILIEKAMQLSARGYVLKGANREQLFSAMYSAINSDHGQKANIPSLILKSQQPAKKIDPVKKDKQKNS